MTEAADVECKHQMPRKWCATCNQPIKAMMPRRAPILRSPEETSRKALAAASPTPARYGSRGAYVVVRTSRANARQDPTFQALDDKTQFVHVDGHPFVWAIEKILELAPNLKVLEVIPPMLCKLGKQHLALCAKRGVKVQGGHFRPELAWDGGECRQPWFLKHRAFLLEMPAGVRAKFDELRSLGFEDAEITARYFCLDGQDYVSQQRISEEFGLSSNSLVSRKILSVLYYLDPEIQAGQDAVRSAGAYEVRLKKIREAMAKARWKEDLLTKLGLKDLPAGLPLSRLFIFQQLVEAKEKREALRLIWPNRVRALELRFGLAADRPGPYLMLEQVGEVMGLSRERIRQLEVAALKDLDLLEDESDDQDADAQETTTKEAQS